jgi:hypothetical protein
LVECEGSIETFGFGTSLRATGQPIGLELKLDDLELLVGLNFEGLKKKDG